jgi:hypothetical protein
MKATTAISRAKKSNGVSSIKPPGDRADLRPDHVSHPHR